MDDPVPYPCGPRCHGWCLVDDGACHDEGYPVESCDICNPKEA